MDPAVKMMEKWRQKDKMLNEKQGGETRVEEWWETVE